MKKTLLVLLAITSMNANAMRLPNGTIIAPGDSILPVYQQWGDHTMRVSSQKTCGRVIKLRKTFCSTSRYIWKKGDTYWMFQRKGSMVIKVKWTRNKRNLKDAF